MTNDDETYDDPSPYNLLRQEDQEPPAEIPSDELKAQVKIYEESITLTLHHEDHAEVRHITQDKLAEIFAGDLQFRTGLLPPETLWRNCESGGTETALWRGPRVWDVSLQLRAFEEPRRLKLPMPGLIFVCRPALPPKVYAAKRRPESVHDRVYHAPLYNVFKDGTTCQGSHNYPGKPEDIPESFFESRFSIAGDWKGRSRSRPEDLLSFWNELEGKKTFPKKELQELAPLEQVMPGGRREANGL